MGDLGAPPSDAPVVQFAASTFYVREGEECNVKVQRLGPCASATSSVDWATKKSPYEGKKFNACNGTLTFPPGARVQEFNIPLLDDNDFGSALQFRVGLANPIGCTLGATYADVMMQDNDVFPTNRYKERVEQDRTTESWQAGESWNMFKEWAKFIFRHTPGSKKVLVADQVDNVIFISEIVVMRLLVNVLSTDEAGPWIRFMRQMSGKEESGKVKSEELNIAIITFGLFLLVPYVITHWLMYRRTTWKVTGGARAVMQENLLRKYLSQDEARSFAPTTFFLDSFGHDVGDLVVNGYNKLFAVAKSFGRLVCAFALTLFYAVEASMQKKVYLAFMGLLPFLALPIVIFIVLLVRRDKNLKTLEAVQDAEDAMLTKVDKSTDCYRMVADMDTRTLVVSDCLQDIMSLNANLATFAGLMANNRSAVHWVTEALIFLWIAIAGHAVASSLNADEDSKEMDLGTFLAILNLIKSNGAEFENLSEVWLSLQTNYPSLWNLVMLMNVNSDMEARVAQQSERLDESRMASGSKADDLVGGVFPEDALLLELEDVSFSYPGQDLSRSMTAAQEEAHEKFRRKHSRSRSFGDLSKVSTNQSLVNNFSRKIQQGSLVAFTGPYGSGKSTILKLIGEVYMPQLGQISIPSHLRILHVSAESMLWPGTVAENIFFGVCASLGRPTDSYAQLDRKTLERGWHVCRVLNLPSNLQELAEDMETTKEIEVQTLPASHRKLIHLARAFTSNPEVLVVHAPTFFLPKELCVVVMDALREFVKQRGLVPADQQQESRRPRTVLFSTVEPLDLKYADDIVNMAPTGTDDDVATRHEVGNVLYSNPPNSRDLGSRSDTVNAEWKWLCCKQDAPVEESPAGRVLTSKI